MKLDYHEGTDTEDVPFIGVFSATDEDYKKGESADRDDIVQFTLTKNEQVNKRLLDLVIKLVGDANKKPISSPLGALYAAFMLLPIGVKIEMALGPFSNTGIAQEEHIFFVGLGKAMEAKMETLALLSDQ